MFFIENDKMIEYKNTLARPLFLWQISVKEQINHSVKKKTMDIFKEISYS